MPRSPHFALSRIPKPQGPHMSFSFTRYPRVQNPPGSDTSSKPSPLNYRHCSCWGSVYLSSKLRFDLINHKYFQFENVYLKRIHLHYSFDTSTLTKTWSSVKTLTWCDWTVYSDHRHGNRFDFGRVDVCREALPASCISRLLHREWGRKQESQIPWCIVHTDNTGEMGMVEAAGSRQKAAAQNPEAVEGECTQRWVMWRVLSDCHAWTRLRSWMLFYSQVSLWVMCDIIASSNMSSCPLVTVLFVLKVGESIFKKFIVTLVVLNIIH